MALTLPSPWVAGEKIKPSRLNGFFTPIQSKFAAGIRSEDLASDAGVKGGQISTGSGTRITNANLENNAVDDRVLKADAAVGHATAAVRRNHIVSGELQSDHYAAGSVNEAALGALSVAFAKLKLTTYSHAPSVGPITTGTSIDIDTGLNTVTTLPLLVYTTGGGGGVVKSALFFQTAGTWRVTLGSVGGSITYGANTIKVAYLT